MEALRLDKLLSKSGYGSRNDVKKLIKQGSVTVRGQKAVSGAQKVLPEDVLVDGKAPVYQEFIYLLMNKPQGVISSTEKGRQQTVIDLLDDGYKQYQPFPVGRLDIDTEGLLLITNDGALAHELLSPKKHVPKTYYAKVVGVVDETDIRAFSDGVDIGEDKPTLPAELVVLKQGEISEIELTICEGKFHQVKRMFEAVGKKVVFLRRISMGALTLPDDLAPGEYQSVSREFVQTAQIKNGSLA